MSTWIEAGQPAPDFSLPDQSGELVKLSALRGRPVVLYFYPADDTPGCTREACAFRDLRSELGPDVTVLGVSPDDAASHSAFRAKYGLNFSLLVDADHAVAERYGAWREKNRYGKKFMGIQRSTFVIDPDGKVAKVWKAVKVDGHDQQVLKALRELSGVSGAPA